MGCNGVIFAYMGEVSASSHLPPLFADWFAARGWRLRRHQADMLGAAARGRAGGKLHLPLQPVSDGVADQRLHAPQPPRLVERLAERVLHHEIVERTAIVRRVDARVDDRGAAQGDRARQPREQAGRVGGIDGDLGGPGSRVRGRARRPDARGPFLQVDRAVEHLLGVHVGICDIEIWQQAPKLGEQPGPVRRDPSEGDTGLDERERAQLPP